MNEIRGTKTSHQNAKNFVNETYQNEQSKRVLGKGICSDPCKRHIIFNG